MSNGAKTVRVMEQTQLADGRLVWAYCWWTIGDGERYCVRVEVIQ